MKDERKVTGRWQPCFDIHLNDAKSTDKKGQDNGRNVHFSTVDFPSSKKPKEVKDAVQQFKNYEAVDKNGIGVRTG